MKRSLFIYPSGPEQITIEIRKGVAERITHILLTEEETKQLISILSGCFPIMSYSAQKLFEKNY